VDVRPVAVRSGQMAQQAAGASVYREAGGRTRAARFGYSTVPFGDAAPASPDAAHRPRSVHGAPAQVGCHASRSMRVSICRNRRGVKRPEARWDANARDSGCGATPSTGSVVAWHPPTSQRGNSCSTNCAAAMSPPCLARESRDEFVRPGYWPLWLVIVVALGLGTVPALLVARFVLTRVAAGDVYFINPEKSARPMTGEAQQIRRRI
jgi:hypothetical protein